MRKKRASRRCRMVHERSCRPHLNKTWLNQKYNAEYLPSKTIASLAGVSQAAIRKAAHKMGLKHRKILTDEHKKKIAPWGRKHSEVTKEKMRLAQLGEKGHNWKGGRRTGRFGGVWGIVRRQALTRDGFRCQECGKQGNLDVHHKIPFRCFKDYQTANELGNLESLCKRCHVIKEMQTKISDSSFGSGCVVWHYPNIYGAHFGNNVSVGAFTEIGTAVRIGDNTRIGAKCFIPEGVTIGNNCFIAPCVVMVNDRYMSGPKSAWEKTEVRDGAKIGAGSVIMCGVVIGKNSIVGAGSVVLKNVPAGEIHCGNPARKVGII